MASECVVDEQSIKVGTFSLDCLGIGDGSLTREDEEWKVNCKIRSVVRIHRKRNISWFSKAT